MAPRNKKRSKDVEEDEDIVIQKVTPVCDVKDIVKPTIFYGNLDDDIDSWIKNFNRIARANNWNEERKKNILPAFLRDRAADYFESLDESVTECFNEICKALKERFMPKELQSLYFSNLFQARQGENQSVDDYASEISKLASRAYSEMSRVQKDKLLKEHFVQGLKSEIQRFVMLSNPVTFEEAFRTAKREECHNKVHRDTSYTTTTQGTCAISSTGETELLKNGIQELATHMKVLSTKMDQIFQHGTTRGRYRESWRGHRPGQGRGRGQEMTDRNSDRNRNLRTTDGRPICNYCRKVGHVERRCFEKNPEN